MPHWTISQPYRAHRGVVRFLAELALLGRALKGPFAPLLYARVLYYYVCTPVGLVGLFCPVQIVGPLFLLLSPSPLSPGPALRETRLGPTADPHLAIHHFRERLRSTVNGPRLTMCDIAFPPPPLPPGTAGRLRISTGTSRARSPAEPCEPCKPCLPPCQLASLARPCADKQRMARARRWRH